MHYQRLIYTKCFIIEEHILSLIFGHAILKPAMEFLFLDNNRIEGH